MALVKHSRRPLLDRSARLKGIKTNNSTDLERNHFYITEYSDFYVDIGEQFPLLPLEETIVISNCSARIKR
ncbi:hypothetical protein [Aeribacillus pallidus]|uniref:hypothetical protein n=1 Tax=Aeribacillus pallidus TaxID=33936 RepID=UPI001E644048|nr:hypothetical protein [Aeribacillus pallidus]